LEAAEETLVFCAFTASALRCQRGMTELLRSALKASAMASAVAWVWDIAAREGWTVCE
jgi:hypothetical protein